MSELQDKVKDKLVYEYAQRQQEKSRESAAKASEKLIGNLTVKLAKMKYEQQLDAEAKKVADRMMQAFEEKNKTRYKMTKEKKSDEEKKKAEEEIDQKKEDDIKKILWNFVDQILEYRETIAKYQGFEKAEKKTNIDEQHALIRSIADDDYAKRVKFQMALAKRLAKQLKYQELLKFDANIITQKMAEIPLMIEDKITMLKELLETLLGMINLPAFNPELPDFDINAIIKLLMAFIQPALQSLMPLTAVIGKIPILGDLLGLSQMMQSGSGSNKNLPSKEEVLKMLPKKPELPPDLKEKALSIKDTVMVFVSTLPMMMIQLIFSMLDLIYSKLKMITSLLPLGGMFPLSLVPMAIQAVPKVMAMMKVLPEIVIRIVIGLLKEQFWKALAMWPPLVKEPNIDYEAILAMVMDKKTKKKAKKKLRYRDVTKMAYEKLKTYGYTKSQVEKIEDNWKKINNGTESSPIGKTVPIFSDNGKEADLPRMTMLNSLGANVADTLFGLGSIAKETVTYPGLFEVKDANYVQDVAPTDVEFGVKEGVEERKQQTIKEYMKYMQEILGQKDLSSYLGYKEIKSIKSILGEMYGTYGKDVEKDNKCTDFVLSSKMEPLLNPDGTIKTTQFFENFVKT